MQGQVVRQQQLLLPVPCAAPPAAARVRWALALVSAKGSSLRLRDAVERVALATADRFPLSEASFDKYQLNWRNFARYAEATASGRVVDISHDLCLSWITRAAVVDEYPVDPSPDTQHTRRAALRNLFERLRAYGAMDGDPTIDIVLPPRSQGTRRRLEDDEIDYCRLWSINTLTDTRQPSVWALSEATATPGEIAITAVKHVDLYAERVYLQGAGYVIPRWARLTPWGTQELARRISALGHRPDSLIAYDGGGKAGSESCSTAIRQVLNRAGLGHQRDVVPMSVRNWAGWKVFDSTGRIDEATKALGLSSLDSAATAIGLDWRGKP